MSLDSVKKKKSDDFSKDYCLGFVYEDKKTLSYVDIEQARVKMSTLKKVYRKDKASIMEEIVTKTNIYKKKISKLHEEEEKERNIITEVEIAELERIREWNKALNERSYLSAVKGSQEIDQVSVSTTLSKLEKNFFLKNNTTFEDTELEIKGRIRSHKVAILRTNKAVELSDLFTSLPFIKSIESICNPKKLKIYLIGNFAKVIYQLVQYKINVTYAVTPHKDMLMKTLNLLKGSLYSMMGHHYSIKPKHYKKNYKLISKKDKYKELKGFDVVRKAMRLALIFTRFYKSDWKVGVKKTLIMEIIQDFDISDDLREEISSDFEALAQEVICQETLDFVVRRASQYIGSQFTGDDKIHYMTFLSCSEYVLEKRFKEEGEWNIE